MRRSHLSILKIGGSLLAPDRGLFHKRRARALSKELATHEKPIVLLHGGGAYSRSVIKDFRLRSDFLDSGQISIIEAFRSSMNRLNEHLVSALAESGLSFEIVWPRDIATSTNGLITEIHRKRVTEAVGRGAIPVLYSDVICDTEMEYYTCSTDQIAAVLARDLRPERVVFLTDVEGVYEKYPPAPNSKPLAAVDSYFVSRMVHNYTVGGRDMHGKLVQALKCATFTGHCVILDGRRPGNLLQALKGDTRIGTRVCPAI